MIIAILGSLVSALIFIAAEKSYISVRSFDSQKWMTGGYSLRGQMAQDIIARRILLGKTKAEVEKILGLPDNISSYEHGDSYYYKARTSNLRCYYLWECRLSVYFDKKSSQVTNVSISD